MFDRERRDLNAIETANVHGGHGISGWVGSFTERVHSTLRAEPVLDFVFTKCIRAHIFLWREQPELLPRYEPEQ